MMNGSHEDHHGAFITTPHQQKSLPDVLSSELQSLSLVADRDNNRLSFLLLDGEDNLSVSGYEEFCRKLGCASSTKTKVVSIVGNAGDGKSYALNKIFFPNEELASEHDEEAFSTSASSEGSCTLGVWAAFEPRSQTLILDTEGMLGVNSSGKESSNENRRTRQLLKVLAISDVVIYKTRCERLHSDVLYFLGDASKAFNNHFSKELHKICNSEITLGPTVIMFHETNFTNVLPQADERTGKSPETIIRDHIVSLDQDITAFSRLRYFGVKRDNERSLEDESRYFAKLRELIKRELEDTSVRSARPMEVVFNAFSALNTKFSGELSSVCHRSFPDEYFTCRSKCLSCEVRCSLQLNHEGCHRSGQTCVYNKSLNNKQYLCLRCYHNGRRNVVVPKASSADESSWVGLATYAWSGSVLECRICGVIYRSRQHWYGNETPESSEVVHTEISHIWPGVRSLQGTHNAARRFLDGVTNLSSTVSEISSVPSKSVSGWLADRIAPSYWRPNAEITNCHLCDRRLNVASQKIHHCRACGEGFCHECSDFKRPVPERGWDPEEPVRVCRDCFGPLATKAMRSKSHDAIASAERKSTDPNGNNGHGGGGAGHNGDESIHARRYGEKVMGTLNNFASVVLEYPLSALKDSARPAYWVPDDECLACTVCRRNFETTVPTSAGTAATDLSSSISSNSSGPSSKIKLHHCRQCGQGVCGDCSRGRKQVPLRGWDHPVRVCDICINEDFSPIAN